MNVRELTGTSPNVRNGAPETLRQVEQWQVVKCDGRCVLE